MMAIAQQQKREKQEKILAREHDISQKLLKLDQWKRDIEMKKEKKETVRLTVATTFKAVDTLSSVFRTQESRENERIG